MTTATYYAQEVGKVWSFDVYQRYERAYWDWHILPFSDAPCSRHPAPSARQVWPGSAAAARKRFGLGRWSPDPVTKRIDGKRILELGPAMGAAYAFMKSSGVVDLSGYTGIEVSEMGYQNSRARFPEARWIQADFTRYDLQETFDYAFERHAIHHMPEPLEQFGKVLRRTQVAFNTVFVARLGGPTISDLEKGFYRSGTGKSYFNVINLFDVVRIGRRAGFNHIRVCYYGDHEPVPSDTQGEQYLAPEVQDELRGDMMRFMVRMTRCPSLATPPLLYGFPWRPGLRGADNLRRMQDGLAVIAAE